MNSQFSTRCLRYGLLACLLVAGFISSFAAPRIPQPPWPQASLNTFGWDSPYSQVPLRKIALNEDAATYQESWSGYALVRDTLTTHLPVIIPATGTDARSNVATGSGAIRFWFSPDYTSASTNGSGSGPGHYARLLELVDWSGTAPVTRWSLYINETGATLYLSGQGAAGAADLLQAPIAFGAGEWRMITVCYSPTSTALWLDTEVIAIGGGVVAPTAAAASLGLVVGSDVFAADPAEGQFEELTTFDYWPDAEDQQFYFHGTIDNVALGPISPEEEAALAWEAQQEAEGEGGGMMRMLSGGTSVCLSNVPVYITNIFATFVTNQGWTVRFDIQGGTNGLYYDIFTTTNLSGNHITNSFWTWLERGPSCSTYEYTNQPSANAFYILGTTNDVDGGGVPDAYELLVTRGGITNAGDDYLVDPGMSVGVLDSALTRAYGALPTNWNYFVLPESVKEALRSDGTPFVTVGDNQIKGGLVLPNGKPRFPILISLGAEAVGDDEIAALTNYVAAGGFVLVGSSSFTRNATGGLRSDFAIASQMGLTCTPSATNWVNNTNLLKRANHRLVNHLPDEEITWRMPSASEETSWGTCEDGHSYLAPHKIWQANTNDPSVQVLITGNVSPYLMVKHYGNGYFIYHADLNPLIAHGGNGPGMYAYTIMRRAIEWAFESAQKPVVKLSPWPYQYDAAFMVRHDLEHLVLEISNVTASAQYEFNHGATGDYYFCTGAITNAGVDTATIVAGLRQAVSNYGAGIFLHNGGLPNPSLSCNLFPDQYDYFHWGTDEAYDLTNGYVYVSNSLAISFNQIETWVTNQPVNPRTWVAPYFNGTRENTYKIQEQLNVKITGEQKLSPFPHWTLSTQTDGKRYAILSEPVSDWFVGAEVAQVVGPWKDHPIGFANGVHDSQTLFAAVDFYYTNGFLINFYSHSLTAYTNNDSGGAASLMADYVVYCTNHARIWPSNAREIYQWWLQRSNAQITVSYGTNGAHSVATVAITGAQNTNTAIEIFVPGSGSAVVPILLTNGVAATTDSYRTSGELIKVRVGTSVTNVQVEYFAGPVARDDFYIVNQTQSLSTVTATGVLSNDWSGTWSNLVAVTNSLPQHGSLSWSNNGSFTYTPATNGTECFTYQANDGTYNFGTANVTILVTKPGSLYSDDFKRCAENVLYPWQVQSGSWAISEGVIEGSRGGNYGYCYLSPMWTNSNYSVEAEVQLADGTYGGGLGGRVNPVGGHYAAWLYPGTNVLGLVKFSTWTNWSYNGTPSTLMTQANVTVGTGWHPLKLVCSNKIVQVFYHGTNVISMTDTETTWHTNGPVSLDFFNGGISVTNFIVSPIP